MSLVSAYKTHKGRVPTHNEDYVWVEEAHGIYIVADGMGGHESGEVASRLAATTIGAILAQILKFDTDPTAEAIRDAVLDAVEAANRKVRDAGSQADQKRPMGATIVIAVVIPPTAYITHAGDARIYLISRNTITCLTQDDSWVAHLVASGVLQEKDRKNNRLGNIITKAVGQDTPVEASFAEIPVSKGDWLLLCSDGLWNMVDDQHILAATQKTDNPNSLVETLIEAANNAGGKDNISVVAIKIED